MYHLVHRQALGEVACPTNHDVLLGRGSVINSHPGNELLRSLVNCNKELYVMSNRAKKRTIAQSIVQSIHSLVPPGRFLATNPETGLWREISDFKATEKASQALRDGATALREQLSADLTNPGVLIAAFGDDTHSSEFWEPTTRIQNPETELWTTVGGEEQLQQGAVDFLDADNDPLLSAETELLAEISRSILQNYGGTADATNVAHTTRTHTTFDEEKQDDAPDMTEPFDLGDLDFLKAVFDTDRHASPRPSSTTTKGRIARKVNRRAKVQLKKASPSHGQSRGPS